MLIKVLGSAAGGGFPQWNCGCSNCSRLRRGLFDGEARTQSQVAVSPSAGVWLLLNASPDLRQQLLSDPVFSPAGSRNTPIVAVILTSADTDCVLGLLHLREFQPFRIYATESVRRVITQENSLFRTLERSSPPVRWNALPLGRPIPIPCPDNSGAPQPLCCRAVPLDGEFPDYVSKDLGRTLPTKEAVVALELTQGGKKLFYAPSLPGLSERSKAAIRESHVALVDGTFWTDDELRQVRGEGKTAREIGHIPLSGPDGLLEQLEAPHTRRVLIHLNNTNPALDPASSACRTVSEKGWEVSSDGMEIEL
jgi:pyrroloquinoline quinone biosynthesis protein B